MERVEDVLTQGERAVMQRVLTEEEAQRNHLVVYLSGAHAYGFPSPDSDLDLKAIHVAPTRALLGFTVPVATIDRAEVLEGVEVDYTSNELAGILQGNGNFIERVLGRTSALSSPLLAELRPLVQRSLSTRVHRHYRGFAQNQLRALEQQPTVKKLLYVLRTAVTGIHLLETGELEADLSRLMDRYALADAATLIERKRAGERTPLDSSQIEAWHPRIEALFHRLDHAFDHGVLPPAPPNEAELLEWLLEVRRARF